MKKRLSLPLILLWAIFACKHTTVTDDRVAGTGCISRYVPQPQTLFIQTIEDSIHNLFAQNNLSIAGLQFSGWGHADTLRGGTWQLNQFEVEAHRYINGLPVFRNTLYFNFSSSGVYLPPAPGTVPAYTVIGDTIPHQNLQTLHQDFLDKYKQCTWYTPFNDIATHPTAPYQDTCLSAVLGYMDAGYLNSGVQYGKQLVKTWMTYPMDLAFSFDIEYPSVFVADGTGYTFPQVLPLP